MKSAKLSKNRLPKDELPKGELPGSSAIIDTVVHNHEEETSTDINEENLDKFEENGSADDVSDKEEFYDNSLTIADTDNSVSNTALVAANDSVPTLSGDSSLSSYIEKVNKQPYLTQEEEYMLAKRLVEHQDLNAAHRLVTSHLRLVVKVALGLRGYGLPLPEMISEGNIGLMQAVKKFNPEKGFRLSTYAIWWIRAAIQEYILRSWSLVKIGTTASQKKLFFNLRKLKNRLHRFDNKSLSPDEVKTISAQLSVSESDVVEMDIRLSNSDQSLNTPISEDDENSGEMIDLLAQTGESHDNILAEEQDNTRKRALLERAMASLSERERQIITLRRLADDPATLDDLSQSYGISRERVRQIENRAVEKMQQFVANS